MSWEFGGRNRELSWLQHCTFVGSRRVVNSSHDANKPCRHTDTKRIRIRKQRASQSFAFELGNTIRRKLEMFVLWIEGESGCHGGERWKRSPLFILGSIAHPPDSEADQSEILVADWSVRSTGRLLSSVDQSGQHMVDTDVCSVIVRTSYHQARVSRSHKVSRSQLICSTGKRRAATWQGYQKGR